MEFEIDFGSLASPSEPRERGPLCASVDGRVAPLSDEECVFQVRGSDEVHVMTLDVLRAMDGMRAFRHREDHIAAIEGKLPELKGRRDAIARVVEGLESRGLVVTADAFIHEALDSTPRPEAPAPIVIRTCDRPSSLENLLASLADARFEGHVIVIDDSRDSDATGKNGEIVAGSSLRCTHLDRDWRDRLVAEIAGTEGCAPDAVAELLSGVQGEAFGGGAAWNAAVLLTAGQRPILLDDDMRWDLRRCEGADDARTSVGPVRGVPMYFAASHDELAAYLESENADWFGYHQAICGQPLGKALDVLGTDIDLETMAGRSEKGLRGLLDGALVKTTRFGYYGAPEMDTRLWFHLADRSNVKDFWEDRGRYFDLISRPLLAHGFVQPQVAELSHFTPTCIDNTELLPPTAPSGRGEDLTFATFLRYLHPKSVALHLPVLVAHERPEARERENPDAFVPWVSRFFGEYALAHLDECEADAPDDRARQLASRFEDIAAAPVERRKEILREFLGFMRSQIVSQLQQVLTAGSGSPDFWQQEIRDWVEANGRALTEWRAPRLRGWPEDLDADGCAEALARDARRYARWLRSWPAMWRAARGRTDELIAL